MDRRIRAMTTVRAHQIGIMPVRSTMERIVILSVLVISAEPQKEVC